MANIVPFKPGEGGLAYSGHLAVEARTTSNDSLTSLRDDGVMQAGMLIGQGVSKPSDYWDLSDNPSGYYIDVPTSKEPEDAHVFEWGGIDENGVYSVYGGEDLPPSLPEWVDALSKFSDRPHSEEEIKRIAGMALYFAILRGDK